MHVSINPSYYCNFRCDWCYLTKEQLSDTRRLDLGKLDSMLEKMTEISHIDLYGGEVGILPDEYVAELLTVIRKHYSRNISVTTNLSLIPSWFYRDDIDIAVSYEFDSREQHDRVLKNMFLINKPLHVIILAHDQIINHNVDSMIGLLNTVSNIVSVEIKPYSVNQANQHEVTHKDFEDFVKLWINNAIEKQFTLQNIEQLARVVDKTYNAFSDKHIYITPNDRYAVLEFDANDKEHFLEFDSLDFYNEWSIIEKQKIYSNNFCSRCDYVGNCLTEHYRDIKTMDDGCDGYQSLITWYKNGR